jgi:hypothetical protein
MPRKALAATDASGAYVEGPLFTEVVSSRR